MARFTTLLNCNSALGGFEFRVTSDGETANIQSRGARSNTWKTEATMPRAQFDAMHADRGDSLSPDHIYAIAKEAR